jgi:hypothetical protein
MQINSGLGGRKVGYWSLAIVMDVLVNDSRRHFE